MNFAGKSIALSPSGLASLAILLGVGLPKMLAILSVETRGAGFLSDRRPQILFERHIFSKLTGGQYDVSNPDVRPQLRAATEPQAHISMTASPQRLLSTATPPCRAPHGALVKSWARTMPPLDSLTPKRWSSP